MPVDPATGLDANGGSLAVPSWLSVGGGGRVGKILTGSGTLTYSEIATLAAAEQDITITGVVAGDACFAAPATGLGNTGLTWTCFAATGKVTVRINNVTVGSITPTAVVWKAVVFQ